MKKESVTKTKQIYRSRWFWLIITVPALFGLVLILLPYGIDYGAERWLLSHGGDHAVVEDMDFNPFTGKLVVHNLRAKVADAEVLYIEEATLDMDWSPLWRRRAHAAKLSVRNASITVDHKADGSWRVGGLAFAAAQTVAGESTEPAWGFSLDELEVENSQIHHIGPGLQLRLQIDHARMDRLATWETEREAHLDFRGRVNEGEMRIEADFSPFAETPSVKGTVELTGLALKPFTQLTAPHLSELNGTLHFKGKLDGSKRGDAGIDLTYQGAIILRDLSAKAKSIDFSGKWLEWSGNIRLAVPNTTEAPQIRAEGKSESGKNGALKRLAVRGDLKAGGLEINDLERSLNLLSLQRLGLQSISATEAGQIAVPAVELEQLRLINPLDPGREKGDTPFLLNVATTRLKELNVSELKDLEIEAIELQEVTSFLQRDSEGRWRPIADMKASGPKKEHADQPEGKAPMQVRISKMQVLGNSQFRLEDRSVSPPFQTVLHVTGAQLENLDSTKPEQQSGFVLTARVGDYSDISLQGQAQPFVGRLNLNMTGRIDDLSLPPLSPYAIRGIGYKVKSGQLDADVQLRVLKGELQGESKLRISNLQVVPADPNTMEQFEKMLKVPLPTAIALLRDKKNRVKLKVPIKGDVLNPEFDFKDAINQVLVKAMKKAAVSYLKHVFQPYGTMITVLELGVAAGKKVTAVRLDPVEFGPGSSVLSETARDYLSRVAELMKTRPQLEVKLCGLAVAADQGDHKGDRSQREQQDQKQPAHLGKEPEPTQVETPVKLVLQPLEDEKLQELTKQRASAIKEHLVKDHGIESQRLFVCHPEYDPQENSKPRVEILI